MPKMKLTLGEAIHALIPIKEFLSVRFAKENLVLQEREQHDIAVKMLQALTSNGQTVTTDLIVSIWKQIDDARTSLKKTQGSWYGLLTPYQQLVQAARLAKLTWQPPA